MTLDVIKNHGNFVIKKGIKMIIITKEPLIIMIAIYYPRNEDNFKLWHSFIQLGVRKNIS